MEYQDLIRFVEIRTERERKAEETQWELSWRIARWQTAALLNVHYKKTIKPEDLMTLPSDKEQAKVAPITKEMEDMWAKWDADMIAKAS